MHSQGFQKKELSNISNMNFYIKEHTIVNTFVDNDSKHSKLSNTVLHSLASSKTKVHRQLKQIYGTKFGMSYSNLCKLLNKLTYNADMLKFTGTLEHVQQSEAAEEVVLQRCMIVVEVVALPHCNLGEESPLTINVSID
jgi:aldehyde:ferredoxin oxidoreductase